MFRFPNPTPILPQLQTFGIKKRPLLPGTVFPSISGRETSILTQASPVWEFELVYESLRTQTENVTFYQQYIGHNDYERIAAVFLTCLGRYGRFFYHDRSDYSRFDQIIASGDGVKTRFRIIRSVGTLGGLNFSEPIGGIDILNFTPIVKINEVPQLSNWLIENDLQTIAFNTAPGAGALITMDFWFYYYCEWLNDNNDFEEFMRNLHRSTGVKFRSTKDCAEGAPNPYFLPELNL
jgi:hypothetical protein